MLAEVRDYIDGLNLADFVSIGKIDGNKHNVIGVYGDGYNRRVEAIGLNGSYDVAGIRVLYHGTKNLADTESVARALYDTLKNITNKDMGTLHVQYIDLTYSEPVFVGSDGNGVFEYVISMTLYYRKAVD